MAILNYSKTYLEVLTDLGISSISELIDRNKFPESSSGNFIKLFFTGDGNIITHGVNYLPLFTQSYIGKGLVPVNTTEENKELDFLRGDGTWRKITVADLPIWTPGYGIYDNTKILDAITVKLMVDASFTANDAMRFKGVITDASQLPTNWEAGDTYRIGQPGLYFGQRGEIGDMLICVTTGDDTDPNKNTHWSVVQNNINGVLTVRINNAALSLYTNDGDLVGKEWKIFGPSTGGEGNVVLIGSGSNTGTPLWARLNGLHITGSDNKVLNLNVATGGQLGGVIIDNLGKEGGKVTAGDTISITTGGNIYLTPTNISNALGFMPTNPEDLQDALTRADRTKDGLAPLFDTLIAPSLETNTWLLGVTKGATAEDDKYGWYPIPNTAFSDTWRKILIGGVDIEDAELHINPSSDVCVDFDKDPSDDVVSISFGLSWWNVTTGTYETE